MIRIYCRPNRIPIVLIPLFRTELTNTTGVIARNKHSLVYTNNAIYVWGRNIGQFGLDTNIELVHSPIAVSVAVIQRLMMEKIDEITDFDFYFACS